MTRVEHKLTVDDLIGEYMVQKVTQGYEPKYSKEEFIDFLRYIKEYVEVAATNIEEEKVFKRFFDRKKDTWTIKVTSLRGTKEYRPHIVEDNNGFLCATNELNQSDSLDRYKYSMNNYELKKIKNITSNYLQKFPERKINSKGRISAKNKLQSECAISLMIPDIWAGYVKQNMKYGNWPRQCQDIEKYFFEMDLATMIELKSIKQELLDFYMDTSKRVGNLLEQNKDLTLATYKGVYLAHANWRLVMTHGYLLNKYNKEKEYNINFEGNKFHVSEENPNYRELDYLEFGKEPSVIVNKTTEIVNKKSKRLVYLLNEELKKR